jgi:hypothetical protein
VKRLLRALLTAVAIAPAMASSAPAPIAPAAEAYLMQAIGILRQRHIGSAGADWDTIVARARVEAAGAQHPAETYRAIRGVLATLGERHSFLVPPPSTGAGTIARTSAPRWVSGRLPTSRLIHGRIGEVALPELDTIRPNGEAAGNAYRAALRAALQRLDKASLCGWVIDLRNNGGGNMWPMLQGLDPLLGPAPFGFFVAPNGQSALWQREGGSIRTSLKAVAPEEPAFALQRSAAPIAILLGPRTMSSGEMTAIALLGRADVRTFGARTAGFTTANAPIRMPDGAYLVVTETFVRDRTGRDYRGAIIPDEPTKDSDVEQAAIRWIEGQCGKRDDGMPSRLARP